MDEAPLGKIGKFSIKSDKNNFYEVEISENILLDIKITSFEKEITRKYEKRFSLEDIQIYRYFLICRSISEVIIALEPIVKDINNIKLIENNNELELIITLPSTLCPFIKFNINEIKENGIDINRIIAEHNGKINRLYAIVENQQRIIDSQNEKIQFLEEKLKYLEKNFLPKSIIIGNDNNKINQLKQWINPKKDIKLNLLYRMSKDGESIYDFYKFCSYKGPTLILFETIKNYKFGAYTGLNWENPGIDIIEKRDKDTFLFSLNLMKKYPRKNQVDRSILSEKEYGPNFGNGPDIGVGPNTMKKGYGTKGFTFLDNLELTGGEEKFKLKEIEVFKVE